MGITWVSHGYHMLVVTVASEETILNWLDFHDMFSYVKLAVTLINYVPQVSDHMGITWLSHGYHMGITWISYGYHMVITWMSYVIT